MREASAGARCGRAAGRPARGGDGPVAASQGRRCSSIPNGWRGCCRNPQASGSRRASPVCRACRRKAQTESALMARLRTVKREVCLLIALCDIFGEAAPAETTARLSDLAEAAVRAALRFCLLEAHRSGKIALPNPDEPETGCGLFVLGMGKLGARELNYSSDIDLIVLFDPDAGLVPDPMEAVETLSRLVRRFVRIVGERTGDGYVFRTDLRLRPDPGRDAARDPRGDGAQLLRGERPQLGTRGDDQGAPRRRRSARRRGLSGRTRALRLAPLSRLRGDRRHPGHEAPDRPASRLRRRSGWPATTSSSAAAASARWSSSRRPSS